MIVQALIGVAGVADRTELVSPEVVHVDVDVARAGVTNVNLGFFGTG